MKLAEWLEAVGLPEGTTEIDVQVTDQDIDRGDARDCRNCAIALALDRRLKDLGARQFSVWVAPYAGWTGDPTGIGLGIRYGNVHGEIVVDARQLPGLQDAAGPHWQAFDEWAMSFDEWAEWQYFDETERHERRDSQGWDPDEEPTRPEPVSFTLDLRQAVEAPW